MSPIRVAILISALWSPLVPAATGTCGGNALRVSAGSPTQVRAACRAARTAARVLAELGLAMPPSVTIRLKGFPDSTASESPVMGQFDAASCVITVAAYEEAAQAGRRPGHHQSPTPDQWRAYVVHEIAHSAVHARCAETCPDRGTHEYIAAVAQVLSLPASARRAFLAPFADLEPFAAEVEISETYYLIDPRRFAAKAYLHFRSPAGGKAFIRRRLER